MKSMIKAAFALTAIATGLQVQAAALDLQTDTPDVTIYVAGASAQTPGLMGVLLDPTSGLCQGTAGTGTTTLLAGTTTATIYVDVASSNPVIGSTYTAVFCTSRVALGTAAGSIPVGKKVLVVKRDGGGSFQGVGPVVNELPQSFMITTKAACNTAAAAQTFVYGQAPGRAVNLNVKTCAGTSNQTAHLGLSDVEDAIWSARNDYLSANEGNPTAQFVTNNGFTAIQGFAGQGFGVAVTQKLYGALQTAQGLGAGCANDLTSVACQPSLTRAQVSAIVRNDVSAYHANWTAVFGSADTHNVNVCRRTNTSGTQATSDLFFVNTPCGINASTPGDATPSYAAKAIGTSYVTDPTTGATATTLNNFPGDATAAYHIVEASSTGNNKKCLSTFNDVLKNIDNVTYTVNDVYALGVLSLENSPSATDKWAFVKLDGVSPTSDAQQRANILNGSYPLAVESEALVSTHATVGEAGLMTFLTTVLANPAVHDAKGIYIVPGADGTTAPQFDGTNNVAKFIRSGQSCKPAQLVK